MVDSKVRSLEEHRIYLEDEWFRPAEPPVVDVWMMGNLIYTILTDLYLFEKPTNLDVEETAIELVKGRRSPYPEHIKVSNDPSIIAMKEALDMCWTQNWKKRPTARAVSNYLIDRLREITGQEDPDVRVVLPERDPHQTNTYSDYDEYNPE
mmetsp:Transcript_12564/g.16381  ORF Transcript_12564/g.16381 Transcript_12564/m.16381 type:complete len:151 (+) Transcript_12564:1-453(+)